ncbi:MAG: GuaB3 family IMP dehydrogenase-related protein, partial [Dehalococcoidia bacterium]|nr:GuaB3 family IMP dehydrogenase-related protein [Dehalococcoidia bacterium]
GQKHSLETLLFGPTSKTDGTENLVGALRTSMATCGAQTIRDFHEARMIIAPAIKTEGKIYQMAQTRPAGI